MIPFYKLTMCMLAIFSLKSFGMENNNDKSNINSNLNKVIKEYNEHVEETEKSILEEMKKKNSNTSLSKNDSKHDFETLFVKATKMSDSSNLKRLWKYNKEEFIKIENKYYNNLTRYQQGLCDEARDQ